MMRFALTVLFGSWIVVESEGQVAKLVPSARSSDVSVTDVDAPPLA